ncbi:tetratricopeptide repeat protein [Gemmatimonas sp.]|jgi:tetratricopeptide (TPR) repeat protein|uniref:tetratricopeptide repeat protein n=1 Tax=Gemmatimonas sp. TaxID=1962908 RepID=UPI0037BF0416
MSIAAKHRKKAAEFEQLNQVDRAIASYVKAIEESEAAGEDVEVALFNKVGDLALRQGRVPDAVTYYERAVEHYAAVGLFNNAIALCNKILRNAPGRANVYFTLGRIAARKGLRGDATRNFLEYATRMQQGGRVEEGLRALAEVADLMPELSAVRSMVDDLAARSGITLPRWRSAMRSDRQIPPDSSAVLLDPPSQDLVFLDVDYGAVSEPLRPVGAALEWIGRPAAPLEGARDTGKARRTPSHPTFRLDPHDFTLVGELPPLVLDDPAVHAGVRGAGPTAVARPADAVEHGTWGGGGASAEAAIPPHPLVGPELSGRESDGDVETAAPPPPVARPDDRFVDLAGWLTDDGPPNDTRMRMREPAISGDEQADFDVLLRHFKEGVARSLGEDDYESHYDLGVAYKEMGLLDDAIAEFQKAVRSRPHRLSAYEALGQCFVEQGRHQVAATVLARALLEPGLDDDQRVGVLYLLAYSCEALQRRDEARGYYQRVYATDINFRDVAARLAALEQAHR